MLFTFINKSEFDSLFGEEGSLCDMSYEEMCKKYIIEIDEETMKILCKYVKYFSVMFADEDDDDEDDDGEFVGTDLERIRHVYSKCTLISGRYSICLTDDYKLYTHSEEKPVELQKVLTLTRTDKFVMDPIVYMIYFKKMVEFYKIYNSVKVPYQKFAFEYIDYYGDDIPNEISSFFSQFSTYCTQKLINDIVEKYEPSEDCDDIVNEKKMFVKQELGKGVDKHGKLTTKHMIAVYEFYHDTEIICMDDELEEDKFRMTVTDMKFQIRMYIAAELYKDDKEDEDASIIRTFGVDISKIKKNKVLIDNTLAEIKKATESGEMEVEDSDEDSDSDSDSDSDYDSDDPEGGEAA